MLYADALIVTGLIVSSRSPGSCLDFCCLHCTQIFSNLQDGRKTAFLNGPLKEEVYFAQPDGFNDPDHLEKVYYLKKALYRLKPLNPTIPKRYLYQQGQVRFRDTQKAWELMYLIFSRPNIVQTVCYCARYQARPTENHLKEVKRIFRYLKGTINIGLWYSKDSSFELTAFLDVDHAGCLDTRKSTSRGIQFLSDKLVSWMSKKHDCIVMSLAKADITGGLDHVNPVIRLPLEHEISKVLGKDDYFNPSVDDVDISTLTMKQYLALIRDDIRLGVVKPEVGNDVEFKINSNFMKELRRKIFVGTDDEDAHKHVQRVLEIVDLFHFPGVKGRALRWKKGFQQE
uniref:Uncharacterized mitochondrial protein AtMg00810-like n=1 Tax=Tanacetum cinerariifolium TaxID=118510 RepID=A0A699I452_TANCI|nr:uncharacterized mitochondrial protein AtMg00810-like [Tanacetum cinerariifolium]